MHFVHMSEMRLYTTDGQRLYLTADERKQFLAAAADFPPEHRAFGEFLHHTGCRISEALEITPERLELGEGRVIFRSLKKRRQDVFRTVPVPPAFMDSLERTFSIRAAQKARKGHNKPLWDWGRTTAWQKITAIMIAADIPDGVHRCPKGLRHGYGIAAISKGVPLNVLQKLMGHAQMTTTAIYADAMGQEQTEIVARMWD